MGEKLLEQPPSISLGHRMLAACSGSIFTSLLVTPLDVVKTRLQAQSGRQYVNAGAVSSAARNSCLSGRCREVFWVSNTNVACAIHPEIIPDCAIQINRKQFTGTWEGLVKIARYEGPTKLWRGLSPTLAMAIPANVIYFTGYDRLRELFPLQNQHIAPLLVGGLARALAATVISPVELFRTKLQAVSSHHGAFLDTMKELQHSVKLKGFTALWKGLRPTLWRDVPFSSVYWLAYENTKSLLADSKHPSTLGQKSEEFTIAFASGAVSGAIAAVVTQPFDVAKTREQVAVGKVNMMRLLKEAYQDEGIRGWFKGTIPRILKVAPACALMISFFELGKTLATKHAQNSHSTNFRQAMNLQESERKLLHSIPYQPTQSTRIEERMSSAPTARSA